MKQMLFVIAVALCAAANNWSFLEPSSSDANVRKEQLLNVPKSFGIANDWRHGFDEMPSHQTPIRVHGGIGP